jgi:hypothetical protein
MEDPHEATTTTEPSITTLFAKSISRQRERLNLNTEYSHSNLAAYLRDQVLPSSWDVHTPSSDAMGISKFPVAHVRRTRHVKEISYLANYLCGISVSDAEDQYNGHCETCAVYSTSEVLKRINAEPTARPSDVLGAAYLSLNTKLVALSWEDCVVEVFGAERRARDGKMNGLTPQTDKDRRVAMWKLLSPPQ